MIIIRPEDKKDFERIASGELTFYADAKILKPGEYAKKGDYVAINEYDGDIDRYYNTGRCVLMEVSAVVEEEEKKNADLEAEIERLRKEARLGSDKKLVALDICFQTVQDDITRLTGALNECRESENYEKLRTAIVSTIDGLVNTMKVGE